MTLQPAPFVAVTLHWYGLQSESLADPRDRPVTAYCRTVGVDAAVVDATPPTGWLVLASSKETA